MLVLEDSCVGEIGGGPDSHLVPVEKASRFRPDHGRSGIGVVMVIPGKNVLPSRFRPTALGVNDCAVVALAIREQSRAVLPSRVRSENGSVIERELASGVHGLGKAGHIADREGNG